MEPITKEATKIKFNSDQICVPQDVLKKAKEIEKEIEQLIKENTNLLGKIKSKNPDEFKTKLTNKYSLLLLFEWFFKDTFGFNIIEKICTDTTKKIASFDKKNFDKKKNDEENFNSAILKGNLILDSNKIKDILDNAKLGQYTTAFTEIINNNNLSVKDSINILNELKEIKINEKTIKNITFPLGDKLADDFNNSENCPYKKYCIYSVLKMYALYESARINKQVYFAKLEEQIITKSPEWRTEFVALKSTLKNTIKTINKDVQTFKNEYIDTFDQFYNREKEDKSRSAQNFIKALMKCHNEFLENFQEFDNQYTFFNEVNKFSVFKPISGKVTDGPQASELNQAVLDASKELNNFIRFITSPKSDLAKFQEKRIKALNEIEERKETVEGKNKETIYIHSLEALSGKEASQLIAKINKLYSGLKNTKKQFDKKYKEFKKSIKDYTKQRTLKGKIKHYLFNKVPEFMITAAKVLTLVTGVGLSIITGNFSTIPGFLMVGLQIFKNDDLKTRLYLTDQIQKLSALLQPQQQNAIS